MVKSLEHVKNVTRPCKTWQSLFKIKPCSLSQLAKNKELILRWIHFKDALIWVTRRVIIANSNDSHNNNSQDFPFCHSPSEIYFTFVSVCYYLGPNHHNIQYNQLEHMIWENNSQNVPRPHFFVR